MRKLTYLAVFEYNGDKGYGVFFPDLPGCASCGDTFDHAVEMAKEALSLHLYGLEKDGETAPARTDAIPDLDKGDLVVPVSIYPDIYRDRRENRKERTTITLPHWLKAAAEKEKVDFSQVLETTLKETLAIAN
jgi:predicted RNase H-like HicB family nuclease